ncbi:MAG TPA: ABC transporter ATP-binding protein [Ferruginibacter sp.]|nr:ABC transporter ATP-binding protein [Ferruginibacter sp.]
MAPLLSIKDLSIRFQTEEAETIAVKKSSFSINKGELVAIVGESGSGKSITALSILRLLPKQAIISGEILFSQNESIDLLKLPANKINSIRGNEVAMIFQEPMSSLNPVFTCGHQVMEAIQLHQRVSKEEARQKTIALFKKVKLPEPENLVNRYPHQLSGGQKQRVMIAMAMSCEPSLLIADEPTTALDVTVQKTILELIKELQQQNNMGVIFITHDLGVVADIADKILVMYKGEIIEQGTAKDILHSPQHPYTKALLACRPAGKTKGIRLPVVSDFLEKPEAGGKNSEDRSQKAEIKPQTSEFLPPVSNILEIKNLNVHFPVKKNLFGKPTLFFKAVDDVSFSVQQGDIVGLVGESGCGKTTLGRSILQLIKPTSGSILLDGKDIAHIRSSMLRTMRKDLQIVFQDPYGSLNPRITIGNAILEPLKVHAVLNTYKQRKEKVMELLEKVSLDTDHFNRYPHQFSGGQRQRICIARALVLNPSFLIFDEAVSALDVSVQAQVLNLLNDLKKEFGFTAIFISHDLAVVHYIADRILVMHKGKIVEEGTAGQVYYDPKNEYTQKLVSAIPGKSIFQSS